MELEELKRKRKEFLEDTWKYYAEDVSRRAIEPISISRSKEYTSTCRYKTFDGRKCAIGRHMADDTYDPCIENKGIACVGVFGRLPKKVLDLGLDFLVKIQLLHDCDDNWNEHGLSGQGESIVGQIEEEFINT